MVGTNNFRFLILVFCQSPEMALMKVIDSYSLIRKRGHEYLNVYQSIESFNKQPLIYKTFSNDFFFSESLTLY